MLLHREKQFVFRFIRPVVGAHHNGNAGPVYVRIQQADVRARLRQRQRQFTATVDFPTPPFPLATAMLCFTPVSN